MRRPRYLDAFIATLAFALTSLPLGGQATPYPDQNVRQLFEKLLTSIQQIRIFDNHSHPGFADDPDVDAMASPPGSSALRIRADNPELAAASKALFGYPYPDFSPQHTPWLIQRKRELEKEEGNQYFDGILNKLNIETVVANRVAMPAYLDKNRFLWAFFVDSFLFPFDNTGIQARNVDEQVYIPLQEKLLRRELKQARLQQLPSTLDGYLGFITSHS